MEDLQEIRKQLTTPQDVVIVTHRNPDGDALGSSLALKFFLEKFHHKCQIILPSEFPAAFEFLPGIEHSLIYDLYPEESLDAIDRCSLLFCLDFNALDRVEKLALNIRESRAYKALIDHHLDPEPFADFYLWDVAASSTAELVYRFFGLMEMQDKVDLDMATCLFTGIITDTGSFRYNTNPTVYRIAAILKELGVDDYAVQDNIFNSSTERQLNILGHALRNRLQIMEELGAGIIWLNKADYLKYRIGRGDTEGLVNYILMVKGMKVALFVREMPNNEIRLSFRSKGDISVQELARNHFHGGGHKNASGGSSSLSIEETIEEFKRVLPQYLT
jgi:phosphoesterase RecJ-like protein